MTTDPLDALADQLYSAPPADFVAVRDEAVRAARERGDREFATAAARLRRPTRAAWLANLLARRRREQLDGLLDLAGSLADAQRTLDGDALRALSARRRALVTAMARDAGRLAREAHESVSDSLLRELGDILEAALADPVVADEVRSGRLTRTVSYSGFGPGADPDAVATPRAPVTPSPPGSARSGSARSGSARSGSARSGGAEPTQPAQPSAAERAEAARRERERAERRRDLADAERLEAQARERRDGAQAAHDEATAAHEAARERVSTLTDELARAQQQERAAAAANRDAAAAARAAAREAGTAATRTARARARLEGPEADDGSDAVSGDTAPSG